MRSVITLASMTMTCRIDMRAVLRLILMPATLLAAASSAWGGHAGEGGTAAILPFEFLIGLAGLAVLLLIVLAWLIGVAWRLRRIERRLGSMESNRTELHPRE